MPNASDDLNPIGEGDLTNCDREPIHVPGAIQPHGALLALDETSLRIVQMSSNASEFVGGDLSELLGNPLTRLLGVPQTNAFRETLSASDLRSRNPLKLTLASGATTRLVNGIVHRHLGVLFLELEPVGDPIDAPLRSFQMIQRALATIQKTTTLAELWRAVTSEVQTILDYDRVMIYRFDRSGNGEIVDEKVVNGREPYLGLHYPASDIPSQARTLYALNYVRHIPDVNYKPADLVPLIFPVTGDLTDLSHSTLRSVSPIHIEYLQNMGVAASLSISIMHGNTLWGLIACHNYSAKFVPYELRAACELLGQVISLRMSALQSAEITSYQAKTNVLQARFLEALSGGRDLKAALIDGVPNLLDYVPSGGATLCLGKDCYCMGKTPSLEQIVRLNRRLRRLSSPVFVTDDLQSAFPEALEFKDVVSGLLSLTISKEKNIHLLWFRPEQVQSVSWGGDPNKLASVDADMRLHPRRSFSLWKEEVRNRSLPWTEAEIQAATELRSTVKGLLLNWNHLQEPK